MVTAIPSSTLTTTPTLRAGRWLWSDAAHGVEVRCLGRGPGGSREQVLALAEGKVIPVRWAKQVHGAEILQVGAQPASNDGGPCGVGDGLITADAGVALAIATADCVPVLLTAGGTVAAAHAGWRGVVAGVVPSAIAALRASAGEAAEIHAWLGPAIGACCYEVGDEVAEAVAAVSGPHVVTARTGGKPHLDVGGAVRHQLEALGVASIREVAVCTRCAEEWLWSFRRDGAGAGRNLAMIWRV